MTTEIKFKKTVSFTGRNGTFKCIGIQIHNFNGEVRIEPITSKGYVGHCCIAIPEEALTELCVVLSGIDSATILRLQKTLNL